MKNCDAMEANILFVSAVLALPASRWTRRIAGVLAGLLLLVAVNVSRICTLYFIGLRYPNAFEVFHLELWPLALILAAVLSFLAWASWARPVVPEGSHVAG